MKKMPPPQGLHKLKFAAQVMWQHGAPGIPVVRPFCSPHIQFVPDAFVIKDLGKLTAGGGVFIRTTAGEDMNMLALSYLLQYSMIGEIAHIMKRTVEINVIIKIVLGVF